MRFYQFASEPHAPGSGFGICAQPQNPLLANAGLRALLVSLDGWIRDRGEPPTSMVPRLDQGTLATSLPQSAVRFPAIPNVTYNGVKTIRDLYDFGPWLSRGIITVDPPVLIGVTPTDTRGQTIYPSYVPVDDADGNNVAGIRLPDVEVTVGTFTGYGLQGPTFAAGDGCDASGQYISFPPTKTARQAAGDPRRSIAERYPTHQAYVQAVTQAAERLQHRGLLLQEDVTNYVAAANANTTGFAGDTTTPGPLAR